MGLVGDTFSRREVIDRLPGNAAIGHVRYSTTGETILRNVQPLFAELNAGGFAIGHNGNLTNGLTLRRQLVREGAMMQSTTDTEVILHLVARSHRNRFVDRFVDGLRQLEGAYAFVGLTNKKLVGARDPLGIRPLVLGTLDGCPILASETCALDIIGAQYVRDVENGEVVVFDEDGAHSHKPFPPMPPRPCIFEYIYFSRPDSIVGGRTRLRRAQDDGRPSSRARRRPRPTWSCRCPIPACRPRSATRRQSGIPYELGIIRNHYVGRTFIEPTQQIRQLGVRLKHSANRAVVNGKRIVLVDNSIVRGTTSTKIVQMMRDAGATRSAFPHRLAADHASGLLRHRHAGAGQAARRHPRPRRHARSSSARIRSPSFRSTASTAPWATKGATRRGRNSPTIASPANIRPRSPTAPRAKPVAAASCRCWPRRAEPRCRNRSPTASRSSPAPRAASAMPTALALAQAGAHVVAVARTVGGLEELDDAIRAAGGSGHAGAARPAATTDGIDRLGAALNERYGAPRRAGRQCRPCSAASRRSAMSSRKPGTR